MDFHPFVSSSKDFTFDFSISHCYTRYRSEEISPTHSVPYITCSPYKQTSTGDYSGAGIDALSGFKIPEYFATQDNHLLSRAKEI